MRVLFTAIIFLLSMSVVSADGVSGIDPVTEDSQSKLMVGSGDEDNTVYITASDSIKDCITIDDGVFDLDANEKRFVYVSMGDGYSNPTIPEQESQVVTSTFPVEVTVDDVDGILYVTFVPKESVDDADDTTDDSSSSSGSSGGGGGYPVDYFDSPTPTPTPTQDATVNPPPVVATQTPESTPTPKPVNMTDTPSISDADDTDNIPILPVIGVLTAIVLIIGAYIFYWRER